MCVSVFIVAIIGVTTSGSAAGVVAGQKVLIVFVILCMCFFFFFFAF